MLSLPLFSELASERTQPSLTTVDLTRNHKRNATNKFRSSCILHTAKC